MKKYKDFILIVLIVVFSYPVTFAAERGTVQFQGVIMAVDLKTNVVIVNERAIVLRKHTVVRNVRELLLAKEHLKVGQWVYIEAVEDGVQKRMEAKKIYLLPKRVEEKERHLYPFFTSDGM